MAKLSHYHVSAKKRGALRISPGSVETCALKSSPFVSAAILASSIASAAEFSLPQKIEFNRDVRPILSENCFKCHGFDEKKREAKRRIDTREGALAEMEGVRAIVPGKLAKSEVHARIHSTDADEQMPPPKSDKKLNDRQRAIIDKWIEQGAEYQPHWAYAAVRRPTEKSIDALVQTRLKQLGLSPSPKADARTLIRRVSLDLTGLPPKPEEVEAFAADKSHRSYETYVDKLLASPAYGERMTVFWLDLVRYADSIGFHSDNPRNVTPFRDYVIAAFNENKRFDQFTIEQLAGDLIPNATLWQRVASGYNRLTETTEEGGAQAKDYEARSVTDRVRSIGTTWLAQTTGCCQCHDHKFDPITTRDFYRLGAFFADIKEAAIGSRESGMLVATPERLAELKGLTDAAATLQTQLVAPSPDLAAAQDAWERSTPAGPPQILALLKIGAAQRDDGQRAKISEHFRGIAPELAPLRAQLVEAQKKRDAFDKTIPRSLVSESMPAPRIVRVLPRGNWLDESGEAVEPGVPAFLPQPKIEDRKLTRLDLAEWIVSPENPLTARVFVNRLWKMYFGTGLSKVLDDVGAQGEPPVNPELLDWLAAEFVESGWDVKHLVRLIVTSDAYQQTSTPTKELRERDPFNREIACQSRFRLDAEFVRDNALAISGLLVQRVGGPSVNPYQPAGYWENLNFPAREWPVSTGENQWRRGLYTWWQRSYMHPSLLAFDAPTREECVAERTRSNIPQQALALLNDPTYVEAARAFASRIVREGNGDTGQRIVWAFKQALGREPRADEAATIGALFEKHSADHADVAWMSVARVILNLHETITRS